jgi:dienelactone hydrolase
MNNRVCLIAALLGAVTVAHASDPTALSRAETSAGWRSPFDGKSLRGWIAPAKNWEARDGSIVRTSGGGDLTYVMYRLPRDYEFRAQWKVKTAGEWNSERIVCHGKIVEHSLNGVQIAESEGRVNPGGCGEFLRFPDRGDAVVYRAIYMRALPPPSSPAVFEEDLLASIPLRVKLWKQMEAYAEVLPAASHPVPAGASLLERFRAENGYPVPGILSAQKARLEKIGEDSIATYYRCFVPVASQMDAYGLYLVPKNAALPAPLVIAQHGNNGSPEAALFFGAGNYKDMIRGAAARGYVVFAPHLITYAARDEQYGSSIPEDVRQQLDKRLRAKGVSLTAVEAMRITKGLDALLERPEVDRQRVGMIGLSLGGFMTLTVSALDPRIKVGVVACGFRYQEPKADTPLAASNLLPVIAPRPLQIQAGRRDPLVSIESAKPAASLGPEAYSKMGAKDRFVFEEFEGGHEFNGTLAWAFLKKYL